MPKSECGFWPGLRFALKYAAFLSAWVIIGSVVTGGANLARRGLSLGSVVAWYFSSAIVVGVLAGVLNSWANTRVRGALVGFAISIPVTLTYYVVVSHATATTPQLAFAVALIGVVLGAPLGAMYWHR